MSYFAIAAPQTVILPNGTTLNFRVNPVDSSQVEIHMTGDHNGAQGTWVIPMKRNGTAAGAPEFSATAQAKSEAPPNQARVDALDDSHPTKAELKHRQEAADNNVALDAEGNPPADDKIDPRVPRKPEDRPEIDNVGSARSLDYAQTPGGKPKVDPVHGVINTAGADDHAGKPKEGTLAGTPESDKRDQAAVGLKPAGERNPAGT